MKSSYYLAVHTGREYNPEDYTRAAGVLANMLTEVLSKANFEAGLCKGEEVESIRNDVEICMQGEERMELVGECLVECTAKGKVDVHKPTLSKLIRSSPLNEWGEGVKVVKKAVPQD